MRSAAAPKPNAERTLHSRRSGNSLAGDGAPTTGTRTVSSLSAGSGEKFVEKARIGSSAAMNG